MKEKDILIAMCGVDENYEPKAQVMMETKFIDIVKGEEIRVDTIHLHGPIVNCFRSNRFMNVDLQFDSSSDPHFVQCIQMLKDFCKPENSVDSNDNQMPIIQLTIMPITFGGEYYASGIDGSWTIVPSQPNRLPDTIRFIFIYGDFFTYRIKESDIDFDIEEEV